MPHTVEKYDAFMRGAHEVVEDQSVWPFRLNTANVPLFCILNEQQTTTARSERRRLMISAGIKAVYSSPQEDGHGYKCLLRNRMLCLTLHFEVSSTMVPKKSVQSVHFVRIMYHMLPPSARPHNTTAIHWLSHAFAWYSMPIS